MYKIGTRTERQRLVYGCVLALFCTIHLDCFISIAVISLQDGSTSGTTLLFVVFLCSMTLGTILMCFLQKRDDKGEEDPQKASATIYTSLVSMSKTVIAPLFNVRMLLIIPLIAYSGLQQAFVW